MREEESRTPVGRLAGRSGDFHLLDRCPTGVSGTRSTPPATQCKGRDRPSTLEMTVWPLPRGTGFSKARRKGKSG